MKILITGGNSAKALKILKAFTQHQVILADYGEVPSFSFVSLGEKNEDTIAHSLLNTCLDLAVDAILPLHHFEIEPMAKAKVLFNEFNIEVLLPNLEALSTYQEIHSFAKQDEWMLFIAGEVLGASTIDADLTFFGKKAQLNGVFKFNQGESVTNLRLFTI
ncbi:ATP-grasp domain-containing protein [Pedobacter insulae]|uniref:Uncharacterized protein n=1 Tax=Pedobacter insulae TaxID=414048 RepID=A0A1I2VHM9_9SPHI|nr:hypothetical protein [Pedobacter insulae]SFG88692.1 hypothetical protein SAMN04489864_10344 [Pedobacter insulae]